MPVSKQYSDYVLEQLRCAGPVTGRKMFGGVGLYLEGMFFALITSDTLYFKVDDTTRPDYEAAGMGPFQPFADRPSYTMQYYEVPVDVLEDVVELRVWANKALSVALRKASGGKKVSKKTRS